MPEPFSVLLPIYNLTNTDHFRAALLSIETQTLLPSEIIIVVDGPITMPLEKELQNWISSKPKLNIQTIRFKENLGLGIGLNHGLLACHYSLVARMDSDDIAIAHRFSRQVDFLVQHPEIHVVGAWMVEFNKNCLQPHSEKKVPTSHQDIVSYAKQRNPMNHPTVMFRKEAVIDSGSYQIMPFYEDYYLWFRMILKGYQFANIPDCLLQYRMDEGFYQRRKGFSYLLHQYNFFKIMYKNRFISATSFLIILSKRSIPFMLPVSARKYIYKLLRAKAIT